MLISDDKLTVLWLSPDYLCYSETNVTSFTELIGLQKRVVKIGVSLFPPANFVKDDRLVHSVKITKITTSDLLKLYQFQLTLVFVET